jgi:hypothetical protein
VQAFGTRAVGGDQMVSFKEKIEISKTIHHSAKETLDSAKEAKAQVDNLQAAGVKFSDTVKKIQSEASACPGRPQQNVQCPSVDSLSFKSKPEEIPDVPTPIYQSAPEPRSQPEALTPTTNPTVQLPLNYGNIYDEIDFTSEQNWGGVEPSRFENANASLGFVETLTRAGYRDISQ